MDLECTCKRHKKNCGCLSEAFLRQAKVNHFCVLLQSQSAEEYASKMRELWQHHGKNEHVWEGGKCSFHPERKCSCGGCTSDELTCDGKPYSSANSLKCPFHIACYAIVCEDLALDAENVIHPEMKRGNSNLCESR